MPEKKRNEETDKSSLSNEAWNWIMLLSGEINKEEMKWFMYLTACIAISIAFFSGVVVAGIAWSHDMIADIPKVMIVIFFAVLTVIVWRIYKYEGYPQFQKRLKPLINIREEIIISGELTDFSETCKKWKGYIEKYYKNLLDKPEMDNANKKLEDGKENLEIKEIKETLDRIETTVKELKREKVEGKEFNFWCVFSGFITAAGLAVIGISIRPNLDLLATVSGYVMFAGGGVILSACFINFKSNKKLNFRNPWFLFGFCCIIIGISVLIFTSIGIIHNSLH